MKPGRRPNPKRKWCSRKCCTAAYMASRRSAIREVRCDCGETFSTAHPTKRFCSGACRARAQYRRRGRRKARVDPAKRRAHREVENAKRRGDLVVPDVCEGCGREARLDGHHDDYERPLDVRWLCRRCHRATHD